MLKGFKNISVFLAAFWLITGPGTALAWRDYVSYGEWDYYGSGRDHPYSQYIDRQNYVGYADYAPLEPDYVDASLYARLNQQNEFTVNIPNDHGGYTAVIIKKSGSGYLGPQGEYYPAFPKVSVLKVIYGK
jgi:hypothetical protein